MRNDFKAAFQIGPTGPSKYKKPHDELGQLSPIPVQITGSLFWDVDHPAGALARTTSSQGPPGKSDPVSAIAFLQP